MIFGRRTSSLTAYIVGTAQPRPGGYRSAPSFARTALGCPPLDVMIGPDGVCVERILVQRHLDRPAREMLRVRRGTHVYLATLASERRSSLRKPHLRATESAILCRISGWPARCWEHP